MIPAIAEAEKNSKNAVIPIEIKGKNELENTIYWSQ